MTLLAPFLQDDAALLVEFVEIVGKTLITGGVIEVRANIEDPLGEISPFRAVNGLFRRELAHVGLEFGTEALIGLIAPGEGDDRSGSGSI